MLGVSVQVHRAGVVGLRLVSCTGVLSAGANPAEVAAQIAARIYAWLDPYTASRVPNGELVQWPFGRPIYENDFSVACADVPGLVRLRSIEVELWGPTHDPEGDGLRFLFENGSILDVGKHSVVRPMPMGVPPVFHAESP